MRNLGSVAIQRFPSRLRPPPVTIRFTLLNRVPSGKFNRVNMGMPFHVSAKGVNNNDQTDDRVSRAMAGRSHES